MSNLEQHLTLSQKVSAALFILVVTVGSLDVAWRGFLGIPLWALYAVAALLGAWTGLVWVKRRYRVAAVVAGAVAGLSSVWFTTFCLENSDSASRAVVVFAALLGTLPGLVVLLGAIWLQNRWSTRTATEKEEA